LQYQSFPDAKGASKSTDKLVALRLPDLKGKSFLDVGCNEGYFCGYALHSGASRVVGIDRSKDAITRASARFESAEFHSQSWDDLPDGQFDVITLLSAIHYANDQKALVHRLCSKLTETGLLVIELGIAPGAAKEWVSVERSIDTRLFPTRSMLADVLYGFAWKIIGHSVQQAGDPVQRYVVHIRKKKPFVYLVMQAPGSGKTTVARHLFPKAKTPLVGGDNLLQKVHQGRVNVSAGFKTVVDANFTTAQIDKVTHQLLDSGYLEEIVELWCSQVEPLSDFAVDAYMPVRFQSQVCDLLAARGFFPVQLTWTNHERLRSVDSVVNAAKQYNAILKKSQPPSIQRIKIRRDPGREKLNGVLWHLDSPSSSLNLNEATTFQLSGWALFDRILDEDYQIECLYMGGTYIGPATKIRRDVDSAIGPKLGSSDIADFWAGRSKGFSFDLPVDALRDGVVLNIIVSGEKVELARLALSQQKRSGFFKSLFRKS